jgi:hypothetical protein
MLKFLLLSLLLVVCAHGQVLDLDCDDESFAQSECFQYTDDPGIEMIDCRTCMYRAFTAQEQPISNDCEVLNERYCEIYDAECTEVCVASCYQESNALATCTVQASRPCDITCIQPPDDDENDGGDGGDSSGNSRLVGFAALIAALGIYW